MKKKVFLVTLVVLVCGVFAMAQIQNPTSDVLGAHLNYGRGCAACHAPHSGARGNGIATNDTQSGDLALWGQNVAALFGKQFVTGQSEHGSYLLVIPNNWVSSDPVSANTMTCLSCHDGNYATGAMMKNQVYETLPATYGTSPIPTLLGRDGNPVGDYLNDHPVGDNAIISCGGTYDWDCTVSGNGTIIPGPKMTQFITNYGFFASPKAYSSQPTVQCTTCHNQHLMNVVSVSQGHSGCTGGVCSGLPSGNYATMFFIRGPYNPATTTPGADQTAQFCRQCHGGESNEMNGGNLPTVF